MLVEGIVLGGLTLAGYKVLYGKLPGAVKRFIVKHPFLTDCVLAVFTYEVLGLTIIAHVAVAVTSLGAMALLHVEKNREKFTGLLEGVEKVKSWFGKAFDVLQDKVADKPVQKLASVK